MSKAITPPPEMGLSEGLASFDAMSDDHTKSQWFTAFVCAAHIAGDDQDRCIALASQLRIVGDLLNSPQLLQQPEQGGFVGVGEIPIGEDQLLDRDAGISLDRHPPQVA